MIYRFSVLLFVSFLFSAAVSAQKPFTEGTIVYKVKLQTADHREYIGLYTFVFKGSQMKKCLKLSNGYEDIVLYNCKTKAVYSLQNRDGKKFAIQLSMDEYIKSQAKFTNFKLKNEKDGGKKIAGYTATKGEVAYNDGSVSEITYTKEWYPAQSITFERFPDAKFFPLTFSYTDLQGMTMEFEAIQILTEPIENSIFRIPPDYKIISYDEYKELSR